MKDSYQLLNDLYLKLKKEQIKIEPLFVLVGIKERSNLDDPIDQISIQLTNESQLEMSKEEFVSIKSIDLFSIQLEIPTNKSLITSFVLHSKDIAAACEPPSKKNLLEVSQEKREKVNGIKQNVNEIEQKVIIQNENQKKISDEKKATKNADKGVNESGKRQSSLMNFFKK